jgi:hypothetical protein
MINSRIAWERERLPGSPRRQSSMFIDFPGRHACIPSSESRVANDIERLAEEECQAEFPSSAAQRWPCHIPTTDQLAQYPGNGSLPPATKQLMNH